VRTTSNGYNSSSEKCSSAAFDGLHCGVCLQWAARLRETFEPFETKYASSKNEFAVKTIAKYGDALKKAEEMIPAVLAAQDMIIMIKAIDGGATDQNTVSLGTS